MMYFVTIATSEGRELNFITASSRSEASARVKKYNTRYPGWKMKLLKRKPTNKPIKIRLYREK